MDRWPSLSLVIIYLISDFFITIMSFGFYKQSFQYDSNLIWRSILFIDGYSVFKSSIDFFICTVVRCIVTSVCIILKLKNRNHLIKKAFIPLIAVFILIWTFTLVKLLALSENPINLGFIGIWLNIIWNIFASLLLIAIWHFILCSNTIWNYRTLLSIEDLSNCVDSVSTDQRYGTFKHAIELLKYCKNTWKWFTAGFIFLIIYSLGKLI